MRQTDRQTDMQTDRDRCFRYKNGEARKHKMCEPLSYFLMAEKGSQREKEKTSR